jgi:carbon storage regulator
MLGDNRTRLLLGLTPDCQSGSFNDANVFKFTQVKQLARCLQKNEQDARGRERASHEWTDAFVACGCQGGFDMLVLTRKAGERIVIADNIVVEVLEVQGNRVRIGIQAPQGVTILREELLTGKLQQPKTNPDVATVS